MELADHSGISCTDMVKLCFRTNRVRPHDPKTTVVIHNQPHIAIGVIIDGTHWHADVGYGGKGLRLPIKNTLLQFANNDKTPTGQSNSQLSAPCSDPCSLLQYLSSTCAYRHTVVCTHPRNMPEAHT